MIIRKPYLLFLGDAADQLAAKPAAGVAHWRPDDCIGQLRLHDCNADLGLNDLSIQEAAAQGAKTSVCNFHTLSFTSSKGIRFFALSVFPSLLRKSSVISS